MKGGSGRSEAGTLYIIPTQQERSYAGVYILGDEMPSLSPEVGL